MNNDDKDLENVLQRSAFEPPTGFTARIMLKIGDTKQLPEDYEGLHLVIQNDSNDVVRNRSVNFGESIKLQLASNTFIEKGIDCCRWAVLAVSGALGIEQVVAFLAGAWTASAAF